MLASVAGFVWMVVTFGAAIWMAGAQREYFKLYKLRRDPHLKTSFDYLQQHDDEGLRASLDAFDLSRRQWPILWQPQADPLLESARRRFLLRLTVTCVMGVVGLLAIALLVPPGL